MLSDPGTVDIMTSQVTTTKDVSLRSRFISGGFWALSGKIISGVATFGANMLLARLLAPEDMGSFFLIFSIVMTFSIIGQWGLGRGLVKLVASELAGGNTGRARSAIISSFIIVTLICLVLALLMLSPAGEWFLKNLSGSEQLATIAGLTGIWIIVLALQRIVSESFRGFHDIRLATIFGGVVTAVLSMIFYLFVWLSDAQLELKLAVQLMILAFGINLVIGSGFLLKRIRSLEQGSEPGLSQVARFGLPLMLTNVSLFAVLEFHMWVLAYYQPESEVALYGASLRLVMLLAIPLTIINAVIPPMVVDMYSRKQYDRVQNLLQKTATIMGLPAIAVFVLIVVFGAEILGLVFGEIYTAAYIPFVILAVGQLINVFTGSPGILLTMSGHERVVMKTALGASTLGVITSLIGVQWYGATGVALGYAVGIVVNNVAMWAYSWNKLSIRTHGNVLLLVSLINSLQNKSMSGR